MGRRVGWDLVNPACTCCLIDSGPPAIGMVAHGDIVGMVIVVDVRHRHTVIVFLIGI
jgi:hypothetical protein